MVALDGERELRGHAGDILTFTVTRHGHGAYKQKEHLKKLSAANSSLPAE